MGPPRNRQSRHSYPSPADILQSCPTLWRVYSYYSPDARFALQETKRQVTGWQKEALGGLENEEWCYNCAQEGHLGDVSIILNRHVHIG